jgi:hypothetical protein
VRKPVAIAAVAVPLLVIGAGVAVAAAPAELTSSGETAITGTDATAVFGLGDRTIRQIRYAEHGTLVYTFDLTNDGSLPLTVEGLGDSVADPRLFDFVSLTDSSGDEEFKVPAGDTVPVELTLTMSGCESLSARAGSIIAEISVTTVGPVGLGSRDTVVPLPEEIRTGSPREAGCANATASSRPPG